MPRVLLSAGEPSGDLHGAALARALRARRPDVELYGLGGPLMEAEGVRLLAHVDDLAVMGFVEVARRARYFAGLLGRIRRELRGAVPALVLPIDYPGLNARLARMAKRRGVPVLYYIAPQVWAWHRSRVRTLARDVDRLAVILPFEADIFRAAGADVTFVGHPLLDRARPAASRAGFCAAHGLDPDRPVLALLPGSRRQEVERLAALFEAAAAKVLQTRPDVQPVVAEAASVPPAAWTGSRLPRVTGAWDLLHHAEAAIVKSGTGTLEAALAGVPLVVCYRTGRLTWALARRLVDVPHVGLVNLVAAERIAPELLQDDATPETLARAVLPLLEPGSAARRRAEEGLARVRQRLHAQDGAGSSVADRVARLATGLLAER
jgi:lipid-A-disaccharide synthase